MPPDKESKTEQPTERRRQKARDEGQVVQSEEITTTAVLLAGTIGLYLLGGHAFRVTLHNTAQMLSELHTVEFSTEGIVGILREVGFTVLRASVPFLTLMLVVGAASSVAQTGWMWVGEKLKLRWEAISPVQGFKRTFSMGALVRLLTSLLKLIIVSVIAYLVLRDRLEWFFGLVTQDAWAILEAVKQIALGFMFRVGIAMVGVAAVDFLYQRHKHEEKLKMTREELKDERKEEMGDPKVRQKQFERRVEMASSRMRQAVPEADVVVTNPTHYAVALKWDEEKMAAPRVVAMGQDYMAQKIKELARESNVPILERKELARALYAACEVGESIPGELYYAVAEVLAFVMRGGKGRLRNVSA